MVTVTGATGSVLSDMRYLSVRPSSMDISVNDTLTAAVSLSATWTTTDGAVTLL